MPNHRAGWDCDRPIRADRSEQGVNHGVSAAINISKARKRRVYYYRIAVRKPEAAQTVNKHRVRYMRPGFIY